MPPSIPALKRHTNGMYYAHWSEDRRTHRKSTGTDDPVLAQKVFADFLRDRAVGNSERQTLTVADCWTVYATKKVGNGPSAATAAYNWKALAPHFGGLILERVDQDMVDDYVAKRTSGRLGRKVQPQTVRRELQALQAALRFCALPAQKMDVPKLPAFVLPDAGEPRERWLTTEEIDRMFAAAERLRRGNRLSRGERFLWIALKTAGRMSAILDLTWDRVDFETRVIHLDVPGRKKTKKRRASVPISNDLLPILERAKREKINDLVLDNKADVWATIQLIAIEAGLGGTRPKVLRSEKPKATGVSPHVLRHTAATHMARRGVPLWIIAKILGNTMQMVERVYAKHSPDDLRAAVNLIGAPREDA